MEYYTIYFLLFFNNYCLWRLTNFLQLLKNMQVCVHIMLAWLNKCTGNSIGSTFHRGLLTNCVYKHSNACTTSRLDTCLDTAHPLHLCQVERIFGLRHLVNSSSRQHEQWHSETGVSTYPVPFPGTIWHRNCMIGQFHWHHSKNSLKRFFSGLNNIFSWLFTACAFVMYINLRRQISVNNNNNNYIYIYIDSCFLSWYNYCNNCYQCLATHPFTRLYI